MNLLLLQVVLVDFKLLILINRAGGGIFPGRPFLFVSLYSGLKRGARLV
jgi:hypothetical protein